MMETESPMQVMETQIVMVTQMVTDFQMGM